MSDKDTATLLKEVSNELVRVSDEFTKKAEAAMVEVKNAGKLSEETKASVDKLTVEQSTLNTAVATMKERLGEVEQMASGRKADGSPKTVQSIGAQTIAHADKIEGFRANLQANQRLNLAVAGVQAALLSADVAEGVVEPQRLPGIDKMPKQRLFVRDLISPGRTTNPAVFWVQQTGFVNNAAIVPEGTKKPVSEITFGTKITPVVTIAHLFKAAKQILDDFTQLQSEVDVEMRFGLKQAEEKHLVFGPGGDGKIHGIVPQAQKFAPEFAPAKRTPIDDLRLAILQAQLARLPSTGFVIHQIDWAKIELTKNDLGGYIAANPFGLLTPSIWGLPVVDTDLPEFEGDFLAGAFQAGAQIFDREDANVVISTENADDFERNMITIRCEERLALAVKRPEAFVAGAFGTAVTP